MRYVHGHAACVDGRCPMFGLNQAECCDGETAEFCPTPSVDVAAMTSRGHVIAPMEFAGQ